jgi:hypothetical protein
MKFKKTEIVKTVETEPPKILATPEQEKKLQRLAQSLEYVWHKRGLMGHNEWLQIEDYATRINRVLNPEPVEPLIADAGRFIKWLISMQPVSYGEADLDEAS